MTGAKECFPGISCYLSWLSARTLYTNLETNTSFAPKRVFFPPQNHITKWNMQHNLICERKCVVCGALLETIYDSRVCNASISREMYMSIRRRKFIRTKLCKVCLFLPFVSQNVRLFSQKFGLHILKFWLSKSKFGDSSLEVLR